MKKDTILGILGLLAGSIVIISVAAGYEPLPQAHENINYVSVAQHAKISDCWLIIDQKVYNVTEYISSHPGGAQRIIPYCGTDATEAFVSRGGDGSHSPVARQELERLLIGSLNSTVQASAPAQPNGTIVDRKEK